MKEGHHMWNIPSKERLEKIPRFHKTRKIPLKDRLVYLHFFIRGFNWYVFEFDGKDLFWGYTILYDFASEDVLFSFEALKVLKTEDESVEVDCETADKWMIRKLSEIDEIRKHLQHDKNLG